VNRTFAWDMGITTNLHVLHQNLRIMSKKGLIIGLFVRFLSVITLDERYQ
jgi:hypothetical protein